MAKKNGMMKHLNASNAIGAGIAIAAAVAVKKFLGSQNNYVQAAAVAVAPAIIAGFATKDKNAVAAAGACGVVLAAEPLLRPQLEGMMAGIMPSSNAHGSAVRGAAGIPSAAVIDMQRRQATNSYEMATRQAQQPAAAMPDRTRN